MAEGEQLGSNLLRVGRSSRSSQSVSERNTDRKYRPIPSRVRQAWVLSQTAAKSARSGRAENRAAARAYAAEKALRFREEQERAERAADLEAAWVIRYYLIFSAKTRGDTYERLISAIDDYAGELATARRFTATRQALAKRSEIVLWPGPTLIRCSRLAPPIFRSPRNIGVGLTRT
jgi:hypothetical protein